MKMSTKAPAGFTGFDEIAGGGLPHACTMRLMGGSGSGKTRLALQFPVSAAQDCKQAGIVVVFNDPLRRLRKTATLVGLVAAMNLGFCCPPQVPRRRWPV